MRIDHNVNWKLSSRILRGARGAEVCIGKECAKCGGTTRYKSTGDCVTCAKRRASKRSNPTWVEPDTETVEKRRALQEKLEDMKRDEKV